VYRGLSHCPASWGLGQWDKVGARQKPADPMRKSPPDLQAVKPAAPLRLDVAAALAFPDDSMTDGELRPEASKGRREALGKLRTLSEAARDLHKSRRWLQDFLSRNPVDSESRPFYRLAGRTKLIDEDAFHRIYEALPCPSNSLPRAPAAPRTSRSEEPTCASTWIEAAALLKEPLLAASCATSKSRSSVVSIRKDP
jgi:hypothetical protein